MGEEECLTAEPAGKGSREEEPRGQEGPPPNARHGEGGLHRPVTRQGRRELRGGPGRCRWSRGLGTGWKLPTSAGNAWSRNFCRSDPWSPRCRLLWPQKGHRLADLPPGRG